MGLLIITEADRRRLGIAGVQTRFEPEAGRKVSAADCLFRTSGSRSVGESSLFLCTRLFLCRFRIPYCIGTYGGNVSISICKSFTFELSADCCMHTHIPQTSTCLTP